MESGSALDAGFTDLLLRFLLLGAGMLLVENRRHDDKTLIPFVVPTHHGTSSNPKITEQVDVPLRPLGGTYGCSASPNCRAEHRDVPLSAIERGWRCSANFGLARTPIILHACPEHTVAKPVSCAPGCNIPHLVKWDMLQIRM